MPSLKAYTCTRFDRLGHSAALLPQALARLADIINPPPPEQVIAFFTRLESGAIAPRIRFGAPTPTGAATPGATFSSAAAAGPTGATFSSAAAAAAGPTGAAGAGAAGAGNGAASPTSPAGPAYPNTPSRGVRTLAGGGATSFHAKQEVDHEAAAGGAGAGTLGAGAQAPGAGAEGAGSGATPADLARPGLYAEYYTRLAREPALTALTVKRASGALHGTPVRPLSVKLSALLDVVLAGLMEAWGGSTEAQTVMRMNKMAQALSGGIELG